MSVNTHRTVHVGRRRSTAARAFDALRGMPASTAPLILAAAALAYMIHLREAHFSSMVQLVSGWGCVLMLFAIGRFPATRKNITMAATPLLEFALGATTPRALWVLLGAVGLLLLAVEVIYFNTVGRRFGTADNVAPANGSK